MNKSEIFDAISWLSENEWSDIGMEEIAELDRTEIESAIERHYVGGIEQFRRDGA